MIQVFKDGKLMYTLASIGQAQEISIVSKDIITKSNMTSEGFEELFFTELKQCRTHTEAYCKAENIHFETFGHNRYKDYDSFRISKSQRLKK